MNPVGTNFFAYFMLVMWMPLALTLFAWLRPAQAAAITYIGGVMLLPELVKIDPPALPPFDKQTIPALAALVGALIWARPKLVAARPFRGAEAAMLVLLGSFVMTVLTNTDPIPGLINAGEAMGVYDIFSGGVRLLLSTWVPFFTARALFRTRRDVRTLLNVMVIAGVLYSLPGLVELKLGPTLHERIYGFMQHDILQTIRDGGYRPMVFMTHGLNLSRMLLGCLLCAATLARLRHHVSFLPAWIIVAYLAVVLLTFKSSGALVWALLFVPLALFASVTLQLRLAVALGVLVFLFPALRVTDTFPTEAVVQAATTYVNEERASSLEDRFECEDLLLEKAVQRPVFGWGANSRNRVFAANGHDISTTDGEWMIILGQYGIIGFLAYFGMYLFPVLAAYRNRKRLRTPDVEFVTALAVIGAVFTADNLPNSAGSIPQFFLTGALLGAVQGLVSETARRKRRAGRAALTVDPPSAAASS